MKQNPSKLSATSGAKHTTIRNFLFITALAISLIPLLKASGAQWVQAEGPYGGEIQSLARQGDTLFAGNYGKIFRSADHGVTWTKCDSGLRQSAWMNSFAISRDVILAGGNGCGVYRSSNNGDSWADDCVGLSCRSVTCLMATGPIVLAGTYNGIFISTDKGTTWTDASSGLKDSSICALAVAGSKVFTASSDGIYFSTDTARHWTRCESQLVAQGWYKPLATIGPNIIASNGVDIFHSSDTGISWSEAEIDNSREGIYSIAVNGKSVYIGTGNGNIYSSADSGRRWSKVGTGIGIPYNSILSLQFDETSLIAGTRSGMYRSPDTGQSWTSSNTGLAATYLNGFATIGADLFAATNTSGIFISRDSGWTWNPVAMAPELLGLSITAQGTDLFTGSDNSVYRSIDNGKNWSVLDSGLPYNSFYQVAATGAEVFAGGGSGIFRLEEGSYWIPVTSGLPSPSDVRILTASGNRIYAGLYSAGVFVSGDHGDNWSKIYSCVDPKCVVQIGSHIFIGTHDRGGVLRSSDLGANWKVDNTADSQIWEVVETLAAADSDIFAGTPFGVYRSSDYGENWKLIGNGGKLYARSIVLRGKYLIAGTDGTGVWRMELPESAVKRNPPFSQTLPCLSIQLVPGARPKLEIHFSLNQNEAVEIRLFSPSGRTVAAFGGKTYKAGRHCLVLDTGGVPNGCYMVMVKTRRKNVVKTVLLAR